MRVNALRLLSALPYNVFIHLHYVHEWNTSLNHCIRNFAIKLHEFVESSRIHISISIDPKQIIKYWNGVAGYWIFFSLQLDYIRYLCIYSPAEWIRECRQIWIQCREKNLWHVKCIPSKAITTTAVEQWYPSLQKLLLEIHQFEIWTWNDFLQFRHTCRYTFYLIEEEKLPDQLPPPPMTQNISQ